MIKKITLFAISILVFSSAFAQMNAVIYSEAGEKFTLYLNGEAMNSAPQSNVKLQNLTSEFYQARVDFQDATLADFSNNNFALHAGMEVTYQVKKNKKGEYVLRFYTENPISSTAANQSNDNNTAAKDFAVVDDAPAAQSGTQTNTTVQSGGTSQTTTTTVTGANSNQNNTGSIGMNINVDGVNMGMNVNVNDGSNTGNGNVGMNINVDGMNMGINMTVPAHTTRPSEPAQTQPSNATIVGNGNCTRSMDAASFGKAKQTIESKGFDDTKLSTAKQVAKANCLTTDQILEVMKVFGFEESRLEFAKYAYDFCFDQNNYYNVSQGFSFDPSTEELNEYIETK
jgi:hypothetical protein